LFLAREPHRLAAERIVLAERVADPVLLHEDPHEVRMAFDPDAHHVPGLALVPVGGRPHGDDARDSVAVLAPDLQPYPRRLGRARLELEQVVGDGEARVLGLGLPGEPPGAGLVDVTTVPASPVAGDGALVPAEVVGRGDVGEKVEPELVAEMESRVDEPFRLDDHRRLAVTLRFGSEPRDRLVAHEATSRISYAGGTPARIFSWRRTIPSSRASGRGGHPGTWTSTGTILSTP